eukprot:TRINITY_DN25298_c0_g2_i2.p1 TRINITY_DN25298_c0_g2~~TRINITY_DN25298_c0_g2_i2.p1  ORF type:complete len:2404 (+),score=730.73 TRINITY_DN25298_c0_g2_i2:128-7339(+)
MSILARQLQAIRLEKNIPETDRKRNAVPPSVLYTPEEAARHDSEAFAALALRGISAASILEPDVAVYARLFEGPAPERDMLSKEENVRIDGDIKRLLLLLSPHFLVRAAQECIEGLLHRYHVHIWNVSDVLACALPFHDSPAFTRLLQGLIIEGKQEWMWLKTFKGGDTNKPVTLVRPAFSKYCSKDLSVLRKLGDALQETAKMQKTNRPMAALFSALWMDVLGFVKSLSADVVEAAMPTLLLLLRKPHFRDSFHAALTVTGALCVKADLSTSARLQFVERVVRHVAAPGAEGRAVAKFLVLQAQLQDIEEVLSAKVMRSLAEVGADALARSLPSDTDCANLLSALVRVSVMMSFGQGGQKSEKQPGKADEDAGEDGSGNIVDFVGELLLHEQLVQRYGEPMVMAALEAFCGAADTQTHVAGLLKDPLRQIGAAQPLMLSTVFKKVVDSGLEAGFDVAPIVELLAPTCAPVDADGSEGSSLTPVVQAFSHKSAKVRSNALAKAVAELAEKGKDSEEADEQRSKMLAGLALQALEDKSLQIVAEALQLKALWASLPQATGDMAVPSLHKLLDRLLLASQSPLKGADLRGMTEFLLCDGSKEAALLPSVLDSCAWVYGRKDCAVELRARLDAALLPILLVIAAALDMQATSPAAALRAALLHYCGASKHALLAKFSKGAEPKGDGKLAAGPLLSAMAAAAVNDADSVASLCTIVSGRALTAAGEGAVLCGGSAAQAAAALVLAGALPKLVETQEAAGELLSTRCVQSCQQLSLQLSLSSASAGGADAFGKLVQALLTALVSLAPAAPKKKKKAAPTAGLTPKQTAMSDVIRLILERPQALSKELQFAILTHGDALRPAILSVAFGPTDLESAAATANALQLLRGLLLSKKTSSWAPDQSFVVASLLRMAAAEAAEVRGAALGVLDALANASWPKSSAAAADASAMATSLQEAGVLHSVSDVLSPSALETASAKEGLLALPQKSLDGLLTHFLAHKAEVLRDRAAVSTVLSSFLMNKSSRVKLDKTARATASAALGLAVAMQMQAEEVPALLAAIPASGLLGGLQEELVKALTDTVPQLGQQKPVPTVLLMAADAALKSLHGQGAESDDKASEDPMVSYVRDLALPLCAAAGDIYTGEGSVTSTAAVQLFKVIFEILAIVAGDGSESNIASRVSGALGGEAASALLRVCVVTAAAKAEGEMETEAAQALPPSRRLPANAHAAFSAAKMDGKRLLGLLASSSLKGKKADLVQASTLLDILYPHFAGLGSSLESAGELLTVLAGLATASASRQKEEAGRGYMVSVISATAAVAEQLAASEHAAAKGKVDVAAISAALSEVCREAGEHLQTSTLAAVMRASAALATLMPAAAAPKKFGTSAALAPGKPPAPLQACMDALAKFSGVLGADALGLLKGGFVRLCRFPEVAAAVGEQEVDVIMRKDVQLQSRLRPLLHSVLLGNLTLLEQPSKDQFMSLARSAGARASLDFVAVLLLERRVHDLATQPKQTKKKKKQPRKKRARQEDADTEDEFLEALPELLEEAPEEEPTEQALSLLTSVDLECRFHSYGSLMQTLCGLVHELCKKESGGQEEKAGKGLGPLWAPAFLPEAFTAALTTERSYQLVSSVLYLAIRFVTEHGIPEGLDAEEIKTDVYRRTAAEEDSNSTENLGAATAALALCYGVRAACMVEALLKELKSEEMAPYAKVCRERAAELRGVLMRSLAVNHPVTFFRALCFSLQLSEHSPSAALLASAPDATRQNAELACVLSAASDALKEREELRWEAGEMTEDHEDEELQAACRPFCGAAMRHVCEQVLPAAADPAQAPLQIVAWRFLRSLCSFSAKASPKPVLELCIPAMARCLEDVGKKKKVAKKVCEAAVECCECLRTAIEQLGRSILEKLKMVGGALLSLAASTEMAADSATQLQKSALGSLKALVQSVGKFLSPFLEQLLALVTATSAPWRTEFLEGLSRAMVESVPQRLLLPAVQTASTAASARIAALADGQADAEALDGLLVEVQRLATLQIWTFSASKPDFVSTIVEASAVALLQLLAASAAASTTFLKTGGAAKEIPIKIYRRDSRRVDISGGLPWADHCSGGSTWRLDSLAAGAFAQFALRLSLEDLKPRVGKVLEWARHAQTQTLSKQGSRKALAAEADIVTDAEEACRTLAVVAIMRALTEEAPDIAEEMLLPMATKDLSTSLGASRRQALQLAQEGGVAKKRRRAGLGVSTHRSTGVLPTSTWWWYQVTTEILDFLGQGLRQSGAGATQSQAVEETLDTLMDPCVDLLDIFEFLPSEDDCEVHRGLLQSVQQGLVALAAACDGARMKRLLSSVLSKTRSEDAEVRLSSVKACHRIWTVLGVQAVSGLSEVVMYAAELLEDEDPRIETAVRAMVKTMEECTGESLQESLKH